MTQNLLFWTMCCKLYFQRKSKQENENCLQRSLPQHSWNKSKDKTILLVNYVSIILEKNNPFFFFLNQRQEEKPGVILHSLISEDVTVKFSNLQNHNEKVPMSSISCPSISLLTYYKTLKQLICWQKILTIFPLLSHMLPPPHSSQVKAAFSEPWTMTGIWGHMTPEKFTR